MEIISLQNCTGVNKTYMFRVIINGKEHVMRDQFLNVEIADDTPFEVQIKHYVLGSPVYKFEPKDNMLLQIWGNRRMQNRVLMLMAVGILLILAIMWFLDDWVFLAFLGLTPAIFQFIMRRKLYVIREKSEN